MAMKEYCTLPEGPKLEPHHQIRLVSDLINSLREYYPTVKMQSVYSTTSADWAEFI